MVETFLSIVAVGRNDNYGGDFRSRLQDFVTWTVANLIENQISSELIFVNYNPLKERTIEDFIDWPRSNQCVKIRIITVPTEVHDNLVRNGNVKDVPVLEYIAKNVGIRRAKGRYVLVMNPNILISEEIFPNLRNLKSGLYYRANRADFILDSTIETNIPLRKQLQRHVRTIWFKGSQVQVKQFNQIEYARLWFQQYLQNLWRRNTVSLEKVLNFISIPVYYDNIEYRFHCNASGDFIIMDSNYWHKLKGYRESSPLSLHVDALMVVQAAFSGLNEKTFWHPIFHRHHERRYDAVNIQSEEQHQVYLQFQQDVQTIKSTRQSLPKDQEGWGLAGVELDETII